MSRRLHLPEAAQRSISAAARAASPREMIGLLAGARSDGDLCVRRFAELPNRAIAQHRFVVEPAEFAAREARLRAAGLAFLGFVHSHPCGTATISDIDRRQLWPHCLQLVVGLDRQLRTTMAAFWLDQRGTQTVTTIDPLTASTTAYCAACTADKQTARRAAD